MSTSRSAQVIGILGTGSVGSRLGGLFLEAGHQVLFGSRTPERRGHLPARAEVVSPSEAVRRASIVVIATPWAGESGRAAIETVTSVGPWDGKILIDATNPLQADWSPLALGPETSGAEEIARAVPRARVVKAFNTVFADVMTVEKLRFGPVQPALFLCGDDAEARALVAGLGAQMGFDPVEVGGLLCARYLEAMAHANIQIAVAMKGGTDAAFAYLRRAG
jgi:hypothetical protein